MHNCSVHCRLLNFNGNVIYDNCIEAKLEAMQSSEIIKIDLNKYVKNDFYKKNLYADFELIENHKTISRGIELFAPAKHIDFEIPEISVQVTENDSEFFVILNSNLPAFYVLLELKNEDAVFSDNCFYLPPGKNITVSVNKNSISNKLTKKEFENSLKISTLTDTY